MYFSSLSNVKEYVDNLEVNSSERLMILVAEKSSEDLDNLMVYLKSRNINFFGGIYARLLIGSSSYSTGFLIQKHTPVYDAMVFPHLMRFKLDPESLKGSTAIVLADGLSSAIKDLIDTVYDKVGGHVKYIGGGAGFYSMEHKPCIFNNNGIFEDALYICIVNSDTTLEVKHGWEKLEGPFLVTRSRENTLSTLDNYSAFEIYRDVIEDKEGIHLSQADFFRFAKDHPFGVLKNRSDLIVRDPISVNDNYEILCVADIPQNSDLYILKGDTKTLLASSLEIAEECSKKAPDKYIPLLFDCISRAMFLENHFEEELGNIQNHLSYQVEGALSIGEISSQSNGEIIIHNKSTILGLLEVNE